VRIGPAVAVRLRSWCPLVVHGRLAWGRYAADLKAYTGVMSLSASEFYEAALVLPPSVRKDIALRLLESVEVVDDDSI
jgi:hypothetical protein